MVFAFPVTGREVMQHLRDQLASGAFTPLLDRSFPLEDVAEFSLRILLNEEIRNEAIEVGGPSNISFDGLVTLFEQHMGVQAKRRRIPLTVLWFGGLLLRPFNEVAARLMRMGYFTATRDQRFLNWQIAADRFGVSPQSIETFVTLQPRS